jgi:L-alanine-DL-glutamate epimerase-like enolase superfamily enzyme
MAKIATLADGAGVPLIAHGYSTDVGVAANRHPIAAPDSARRLEYRVEDSPSRWELVEESFPVEDGRSTRPFRPYERFTLTSNLSASSLMRTPRRRDRRRALRAPRRHLPPSF